MNKHIARFVVIGISSLALISCGGLSSKNSASSDGAVPYEDRNNTGVYAGGVDDGVGPVGSRLGGSGSLLSNRIVYFDLDRSDIGPQYREIIEAHARYLAGSPSTQITLAGHCDERGSREYNLALGERRAKAVSRLMNMLGASNAQLQVVSYGEEQPAAFGQNESSWRQNRRVEIMYYE